MKAARYFDPPVERVEIPFPGRPGEGNVSVGLLRKPRGVEKPQVVIIWGGIDAFKEERPTEPYLRAGMATLCIDMPGVADAPLAGSEHAERLWDAVLDWIGQRPDLDSERVGIVGGSTGGYWATKVAHTHHGRIRAAVITVVRHTTLLPRNGSSKHSAANIHSSLLKLSRVLSAAPAPKSGLNTARDFLCSIREYSTIPACRCFASTALTIAFFRLPICIYCSNMATLRPHASFPAATWEGAGHRE